MSVSSSLQITMLKIDLSFLHNAIVSSGAILITVDLSRKLVDSMLDGGISIDEAQKQYIDSVMQMARSDKDKKKVKDETAGRDTEADIPDNPSSLQREVEKGRAPKEVDRVDKPHVKGQKPHVHFKDKTSLNNDGTVHDKHREIPNLSDKVRKWLESHGWRVNN